MEVLAAGADLDIHDQRRQQGLVETGVAGHRTIHAITCAAK
jgi:hypothetical protein